jgi:hypothetical protein
MRGSGNRDEDQENMSSQTDNIKEECVCVPLTQMQPTTGELCGEGENK